MTRPEKRKFHYIYKITRNDGSGKYYIGLHSTDDLHDGYFGSGQRLWKSIKKHGKEKHSKEILEFLHSRHALLEREKELVNEKTLTDPLCMNLAIGGGGSWGTSRGISDQEHRKKISEAQKQRLANGGANRWQGEAGSKLSTTKNLERVANGTNPWAGDLGSKHAKEVCAKQITEGRHPFQQQQTKDKVSARCKQQISEGSHPFQKLERITCCHCGKSGTAPNMRRWHFDNCKKK